MPLSFKERSLSWIKYLLSPILITSFPALYYYGTNVNLLRLPSLERMLLLNLSIAVLVYGIASLVFRGKFIKAANATFIFLIFFNLYGIVYDWLIKLNIFTVSHLTLLPPVLLIALYAAWLVTKLNQQNLWKVTTFVAVGLVAFNLVRIVPTEIGKQANLSQQDDVNPVVQASAEGKNYPDIYYIILDEFSGFDVAKDYFHYDAQAFIDFAKSKGFFVALDSRSSSSMTLHQLAERLNYESFPVGTEHYSEYSTAIINNKVMQFVKSLGYSTTVFEETGNFLEAMQEIPADYSMGYAAAQKVDSGFLFDEFGTLVTDKTMLRIFSSYYRELDPTIEQHKTWINFTMKEIGNLQEIPQPRFVYAHLLLPHMPFIYDENGNPTNPDDYYNWDYYNGQYKYAIKVAERMIDEILAQSDPNHPPIIVIQSDHGARNIPVWQPGSKTLDNFPSGSSSHILNMMYLPGFDTSQIPQDVKPINTFPMLFDHYFGQNIPLQ